LFNGTPPRNKPGNPEALRYALTCRRGEDGLASTFVSILEPYQGGPQVLRASRPAVADANPHDGPVVLVVELADGAVDTIMYAPPGRTLSDVRRGMDGRLGFVRRRGETVERAALIGGRELHDGRVELKADVPAWTGRATRLSEPKAPQSRVWVDAALPTDGRLTGEWIAIANDGAQNAFYRIESVEREGQGSVISLGDVSLERGYKDEKDYGQGMKMNFATGDPFVILNHVVAAGDDAR